MIIPIQYVEVLVGSDIKDVAREMVGYAKFFHCIVKADFNGVEIQTDEWSTPESVVKSYEIELKK